MQVGANVTFFFFDFVDRSVKLGMAFCFHKLGWVDRFKIEIKDLDDACVFTLFISHFLLHVVGQRLECYRMHYWFGLLKLIFVFLDKLVSNCALPQELAQRPDFWQTALFLKRPLFIPNSFRILLHSSPFLFGQWRLH